MEGNSGFRRRFPRASSRDLSARILSTCISPRSPIDIVTTKKGIAGIGSLADDDCSIHSASFYAFWLTRADIADLYRICLDVGAISQERMCAFRPCNFYHKFRRQFFAPGHARFSRLVPLVLSLSLSLSLTLFLFLCFPHAAAKIAGILRSIRSGHPPRYRDLSIGPANRYSRRTFFHNFQVALTSSVQRYHSHVSSVFRWFYSENPIESSKKGIFV